MFSAGGLTIVVVVADTISVFFRCGPITPLLLSTYEACTSMEVALEVTT
jgi:hypothetical protein